MEISNCDIIDPRDKSSLICPINIKSDNASISINSSIVYSKASVFYIFARAKLSFFDCVVFGEQGLCTIEKISGGGAKKQRVSMNSIDELKKIFPGITVKGKFSQEKPALSISPKWAKEWSNCAFPAENGVGAKLDKDGFPVK
jgi:hypothetical protein